MNNRKITKKLAGFTLIELLIALFISISVILFTISGINKCHYEMEWKNALISYEKSMMTWQEQALRKKEKIRIKFVKEGNYFEANLIKNRTKISRCYLPKQIKFSTTSYHDLQYNENGNFSHLFKISFYDEVLRKQQNYSLAIGGRLWKNHG